MPRVESIEVSKYLTVHYLIRVFCTEAETGTIAQAASTTSDVLRIFSALAQPQIAMLRGSAKLLSWKARRCLQHGKCLVITFSHGIPLFQEYDPADIDKWLKS